MEPPGNYRSKEEVEEWQKKDPVVLYETKLISEGVIAGQDVESIRDEMGIRIDEAEAEALESPMPEPESAYQDLYAGQG
jgi:TPP-dependent pyruvate/acetoin dehydrogenase alpha subunit